MKNNKGNKDATVKTNDDNQMYPEYSDREKNAPQKKR